MEFRDRIGKILLVTLVFILAFVAYKRTYNAPASVAVTSVEKKSDGTSLVAKEDVEKIVRQFILDNPGVLIESIERMQQNKMEEMNAQVNDLIKSKKIELEGEKMSPILGNGSVAVVMFYDVNCTYCKKANAVVDQLLESNKDIKVIYKPLPILGESSEYATKIELAVYKLFPDKFKAVHSDFMSQKITSREDVVLILDKNAIPVATVEAEFESADMKTYLKNSAALASDLRMQGVPNFIIGDALHQGFIELSRMQSIIADVQSKAIAAPASTAPVQATHVETIPVVVTPPMAPSESPKEEVTIVAPVPGSEIKTDAKKAE